jgi:hypothetical protein
MTCTVYQKAMQERARPICKYSQIETYMQSRVLDPQMMVEQLDQQDA